MANNRSTKERLGWLFCIFYFSIHFYILINYRLGSDLCTREKNSPGVASGGTNIYFCSKFGLGIFRSPLPATHSLHIVFSHREVCFAHVTVKQKNHSFPIRLGRKNHFMAPPPLRRRGDEWQLGFEFWAWAKQGLDWEG